jgi:hypothetical protein
MLDRVILYSDPLQLNRASLVMENLFNTDQADVNTKNVVHMLHRSNRVE